MQNPLRYYQWLWSYNTALNDRSHSPKKRTTDLTRFIPRVQTQRRQLLGAAAVSIPLMVWPVRDVLAQFRVEVSGVGLTQFPFSVAGFRGNDAASEDIAAIVR
ncbi:MAG: TolB protein, partial [Hydrogenophaga sp.]